MTTQVSVQKALTLIQEVEERLARLRELIAPSAGVIPDAGDRVLADVLEGGAALSRAELYEIAQKHGMDRRGLGGFFRESGQQSLQVLPGTDRIVLTPYGAERAKRFLDRRAARTYEVPARALQRIAEASFAEEWDSPEDSVYDRA